MQDIESNIEVEDEGAVENAGQAQAANAVAPNHDLKEALNGTTLTECVHEAFNFGSSSLTDVDKFKRRLIRSIARYTFVDKMPQEEMWEKLRKDTDCDCFMLMKRMRTLTLKKLKRLLAADDMLENVTKIARLTVTDWLLFDLVLVHENVDLIGKDWKWENTVEDPQCLSELFELVSKYNIEEYQMYKMSLSIAWLFLTIEYNSRGRQCSPMLLQRRWYQMKQVTRLKFYSFWYSYRGNNSRLEQVWDMRPTVLETKIAKRYPGLIIQPFSEWEQLVAKEAIILREDFEKLTVVEPTDTKNVEDVEIIETPVETIEVDEDSDDDVVGATQEQGLKLKTYATKTNSKELDVRIVNIKCEPSENNPNEKPLSSKEIFINQTCQSSHKENINDENSLAHCSDVDYNENNELLPKIMNVTGGVQLIESDDEVDESVPQHTFPKDSSEIDDNVKNTEIITPNCGVNSEDVLNYCSMSDSNKVTDFANNRQEFEVHLDDLIIIDDGIAIEDDGTEEECEDMIQVKPELEQAKKNEDEEKEDTPKFDFKLLLTPVVYTKKLNDMDVFKFIDFSNVRDIRIIECSYKESKPVDVQQKHKVIEDNINQTESEKKLTDTESSDEMNDHQKIKYSSWLLQKPKNRTYNPIQLCKNPDFNTRLKRLNAGFLMSERNRLMLKECKPLTIDLHKAFEVKLGDGKLFLKDSKFTHNSINTLKPHSLVEPKTIKPLEKTIDLVQENPKNMQNTNDFNSLESYHKNDLKYEHKIDSKETNLNKDIQLDPTSLIKEAFGTCRMELKQQKHQNSLQLNVSNTNSYKENVDDKKNSKKVEPKPDDNLNFATEKVVSKKIEVQGNINLETERIECNKHICDVGDIQKMKLIEPQPEPTNYRKGKKQLSRLQIQRSLSKIFHKTPLNYRDSTILPSRIPLKWDINSKPIQNSNKISDAYGDALLASSTLEKMISVLSYQPIDSKLKKNKRKKVIDSTKKKISWSEKHSNKTKDKCTEKRSTDELKIAEDIDQNKNTKSEANGGVKNTNVTKHDANQYCCWAMEKLLTNKKPKTPHYCPHPVCICCCRDRLLEKTLQEKRAYAPETKKRKGPNIINIEKAHKKNSPRVNKLESETNIEIKKHVTAESMPIILSDDDEIDAKGDNNIDKANKVIDSKNDNISPSNLQEFEHVDHMTNESNNASLSVQSTVPSIETNITSSSPVPIIQTKNTSHGPDPSIQTKITSSSPVASIQIKLTGPNQSTSTTQTGDFSFAQTCKTRVIASSHYRNKSNASKSIEIPSLRVTSGNLTQKPSMVSFSVQVDNANATNFNSRKDQIKYNVLPHSTEATKPIFLGKNKILLYSSEKPDAIPKQSLSMEGYTSSELLPPGVQIILLPSGELALSIQPGLDFNSEEISKLSDILISVQKHLTAAAKNSTAATENSEAIVTHIDGNNELPSQTNSSKSILQTLLNESEQPKELVPLSNENDSTQNFVDIALHNVESNAIDKNTNEGEITLQDQSLQSTNDTDSQINKNTNEGEITLQAQSLQSTNDTDSQINKKSILSDLMELSGISEKDAVTEAKTLNTSMKSAVTAVIALPQEMTPKQAELGTNTRSQIWTNFTEGAPLETRKELSVVSSFDELKKCHEKSCQFYKMDVTTGEIYPINLKIKKKTIGSVKEKQERTSTTACASACIDLTEDQGDEVEKNTETNVVEKGNVKPIKLIRTIHSTGSNPTRSIILEPRQASLRSQEPSALVNILKTKRSLLKRHVDTDNNLIKSTIVEDKSEIGGRCTSHNDSDSDDEPLAKKALRKRDDDHDAPLHSDVTESNEIPLKSGPIDNAENSLDCMEEELMPEFMNSESGDEGEDCILGV